ncbi:MAG: tetratricopeptide repeat protein [Flavobacteriales bacterium]|nr:tetratricopeptide repeat protein [Flavobacteriales bacterium]MBP9080618.1 tetratricopeptide repeat protein [Flavobacteriales bacterium]
MRSASLALALFLTICSCSESEQLCNRFFSPYPDLVSQRQRNPLNGDFLDAMALYADKDYAEAIPALQQVVERDARNTAARFYLVNAILAEGDPYKAEMHLDFMENYRDRNYSDQVDWYNALCWLCEGNADKAREQAEWIAGRAHTYRTQAAELAEALSNS